MTLELDPDTDLVLTRTLSAPRALIWRCWTEPAHLAQWFVPRPHRVVSCDLDVRVGGRCDTVFEVDGQTMPNRGVYLEVTEGEKLVFTDTYTEGWKPAPEPFMTAIVTFADAPGGGTTYTAIARHRNAASARQHAEMGFHDGWGTVARQLDAHAAELGVGDDPDTAARTMRIEREIAAPLAAVWEALTDPAALPQWWGPDGFRCRTARIDLREGGAWVFDMIGPDGTIYPNHHRFTRHVPLMRIDYELRAGEDGPKHADAWIRLDDLGGRTRVRLGMVFASAAEFQGARAIGAEPLGRQTLGKLARHLGAD